MQSSLLSCTLDEVRRIHLRLSCSPGRLSLLPRTRPVQPSKCCLRLTCAGPYATRFEWQKLCVLCSAPGSIWHRPKHSWGHCCSIVASSIYVQCDAKVSISNAPPRLDLLQAKRPLPAQALCFMPCAAAACGRPKQARARCACFLASSSECCLAQPGRNAAVEHARVVAYIIPAMQPNALPPAACAAAFEQARALEQNAQAQSVVNATFRTSIFACNRTDLIGRVVQERA